jgi:VIT1/CCC1 family predicted Fe2+/Mn2+ transporter
MVSIELGEEKQIAVDLANKYFEGNLSKFLRHLIREYDSNKKTSETTTALQTIAFLLIGFSLIISAVAYVVTIVFIILPVVLALCGIFLIIFVIIRFRSVPLKVAEVIK